MYSGAPAGDTGGASSNRSEGGTPENSRISAGGQRAPGDDSLESQGPQLLRVQANAEHQRDTDAPSTTQASTSQLGVAPGVQSGTPPLRSPLPNPSFANTVPFADKLGPATNFSSNPPSQSMSTSLSGNSHQGTPGASIIRPPGTGPRRGRPPRNPRPPQPDQPVTASNAATREMSGIPHGLGTNPYMRRPPMSPMQFSPALNAQQQKALMARAVQMSKAHNQPSYTPLHALLQMGFMYVRNSQLPNMPPHAAQGGTILRADEAAALGLLNNTSNTTSGPAPHPQLRNTPTGGSNLPWQSTSIPPYAQAMPPNTQRQGVNPALSTVPPSLMMSGQSKPDGPQNIMDGTPSIGQASNPIASAPNFLSSFAPSNRTDIPLVHGGAPPASSSVGVPVTLQNTRLSKIGTDFKPSWEPMSASQLEELEQIMRKDAKFTSIWQAQQKSMDEEFVACVAPVLHPSRPNVVPRPVAWWEKTMQEPAAPMRSSNYEPFRLILPAQRQRSLEQSGRRSRASVPLSGIEVEKAINAPETIVAIRLELDHEPFKLRDTFLWNAAEETSSLEAFALAICEDMGLPSSVFVPLIRTSIQTQVQEYVTAMALRPEPTPISAQAESLSAAKAGKGLLSEESSEYWGKLRNRILQQRGDSAATPDEQTATTSADSRLDQTKASPELRTPPDTVTSPENASADAHDGSRNGPKLKVTETDSIQTTDGSNRLTVDSVDALATEAVLSPANEQTLSSIITKNDIPESTGTEKPLLPANENQEGPAAINESVRSPTQFESLETGEGVSKVAWRSSPLVQSNTKLESDPNVVTPSSIETSGELRVLIKIDILVGAQNLVDQFEWDLLNHDEVIVDRFAEKFAADLGLSGEFMTAIAHSIHEQVSTHLRLLYLLGYPYNRLGSMDEEVRTAFLAELNAQQWIRTQHDVDAYTPKLLQLTPSDALLQEREHERDMRRKRRQTKGRRGVNLAEREPQRTIRSAPVYGLQGGIPEPNTNATYHPTRRAAAAAANANLATSVEDSQEDSAVPPAKRVRSDRLEMQFRYPGGLGQHSAPTHPRFRSNALTQIPLDVLGRRTGAATPSQPDPTTNVRGRPSKDRASLIDVTTSRGIRPEDLERQHPNMHEGVWHCGNCGVPGYLAPGRRKGPAGEKTLCGPCGKYYHRHRRMDNVRYTRDPAYHSKRLKQTSQSTSIENEETNMSDFDDLPTEAMDHAQGLEHHDSASRLDRTLDDSETDEAQDRSIARPPAWLVSAADALRLKYPNDIFQTQLRPQTAEIPAQVGNEWRIRCADCPGKVYKPGPGESLINFEIHLKNRSHRTAVSRRIGHIQ